MPPAGATTVPTWILNGTHQIFHPIQKFASPLADPGSPFPLRLTKIILGPKCREALVNKVQLRSLLRALPSSPTIALSRIDFYR